MVRQSRRCDWTARVSLFETSPSAPLNVSKGWERVSIRSDHKALFGQLRGERMVARSARDVFGYGIRLFGYLLVSVLLGGALIAGGIGTVVTLEPGVVFGSESPGSYAPVAAGGGLAVVGGLVLVAGVFATLFALLSDAVAAGLESAARTDSQTEPADDSEGSPQPTAPDTDTDDSSSPAKRESSSAGFGERDGDPLAGSGTGDPPSGTTADTPSRESGQSDDPLASDPAAWKREIESELDEPTDK